MRRRPRAASHHPSSDRRSRGPSAARRSRRATAAAGPETATTETELRLMTALAIRVPINFVRGLVPQLKAFTTRSGSRGARRQRRRSSTFRTCPRRPLHPWVDSRHLDERRVGKALAVAETMIGRRLASEHPAPPLKLLLQARKRLDLTGGLAKPLVQNAQQTRARHRATLLPGRRDEIADLVQRQPERLRLADEVQPTEVRLAVQAIAARTPPRRR